MKLPQISGLELIKRLRRFGFVVTRQKGSHVCLHKKEDGKTLLVVVPRKVQIKKGTSRSRDGFWEIPFFAWLLLHSRLRFLNLLMLAWPKSQTAK